MAADRESRSKSLKNLFTEADTALGQLAGRAASMVALRDQLAAALPDGLGARIADASVNADNVLVVVCTSSAWAARLRFHADELLSAARRNGCHAARCRVCARPARP